MGVGMLGASQRILRFARFFQVAGGGMGGQKFGFRSPDPIRVPSKKHTVGIGGNSTDGFLRGMLTQSANKCSPEGKRMDPFVREAQEQLVYNDVGLNFGKPPNSNFRKEVSSQKTPMLSTCFPRLSQLSCVAPWFSL